MATRFGGLTPISRRALTAGAATISQICRAVEKADEESHDHTRDGAQNHRAQVFQMVHERHAEHAALFGIVIFVLARGRFRRRGRRWWRCLGGATWRNRLGGWRNDGCGADPLDRPVGQLRIELGGISARGLRVRDGRRFTVRSRGSLISSSGISKDSPNQAECPSVV